MIAQLLLVLSYLDNPITIFGKPTHIIAGDNQHYNIQIRAGVLEGTHRFRHQRTNMSSGQREGSMKMAVSAHSHVMWNYSVVVILRCYGLHGQLVLLLLQLASLSIVLEQILSAHSGV